MISVNQAIFTQPSATAVPLLLQFKPRDAKSLCENNETGTSEFSLFSCGDDKVS